MKTFAPRHASTKPSHLLAAAVIAAIAFGCASPAPARAQTMDAADPSTPPALVKAALGMRADYRLQQWQRLSRKNDRDSLIAATLIGMANDADHQPVDGHADIEQRLARSFGRDPLAQFTLALACQVQKEPCADPGHYDELVRIEPDNAVNWLLLPNNASPSEAQLHAAAAATKADSHLRDMIRIVRAALAGQPAPAMQPGVDARELALLLRRDAADQVPLPAFRGAIAVCKPDVVKHPADCIALGHRLIDDRSGAILTRMIGVVLLRRLEKGSADDVTAKAMRARYVWLGEQLESSKAPYQERLKDEIVAYGEWEAYQRAVERLGSPRTPPANWVPKNPQTLLMSEERTPAAAAH
jgi:hypothetical protein